MREHRVSNIEDVCVEFSITNVKWDGIFEFVRLCIFVSKSLQFWYCKQRNFFVIFGFFFVLSLFVWERLLSILGFWIWVLLHVHNIILGIHDVLDIELILLYSRFNISGILGLLGYGLGNLSNHIKFLVFLISCWYFSASVVYNNPYQTTNPLFFLCLPPLSSTNFHHFRYFSFLGGKMQTYFISYILSCMRHWIFPHVTRIHFGYVQTWLFSSIFFLSILTVSSTWCVKSPIPYPCIIA